MKKFLSLVLAAVLLCLTFAACGDSTTNSSSSEASADSASDTSVDVNHKLGILAPAATQGWFAAVAYDAEVYCKQLGTEYKVLTSNNVDEMITQLGDLKKWGAEGIVVFPEWDGMEIPIQKTIDDGIPVVSFDIEISANGVYHLSGDNEDMGAQSAQYIVDKIGTEGTVVLLDAPDVQSLSEPRELGFTETMAEIAPNINIITYPTKFTQEAGLADFTDVLAANPQIDAVYSMDDDVAIGVIQAIEKSGRTDVKVVAGGGGSQEYFGMMQSNQDIWIASTLYSPATVAQAVDMALDILNGKTVDDVRIIPTTIVDRDNCADYLDADSPY